MYAPLQTNFLNGPRRRHCSQIEKSSGCLSIFILSSISPSFLLFTSTHCSLLSLLRQPLYGCASADSLTFNKAVGHQDLFYVDDKDVEFGQVKYSVSFFHLMGLESYKKKS